MEIKFFFRQRHTLSTSFDIFVITYRVTNFLLKLVDMLLFSTEKTEFPFLVFPYFWVMPEILTRLTRFEVKRNWSCAYCSGRWEHVLWGRGACQGGWGDLGPCLVHVRRGWGGITDQNVLRLNCRLLWQHSPHFTMTPHERKENLGTNNKARAEENLVSSLKSRRTLP